LAAGGGVGGEGEQDVGQRVGVAGGHEQAASSGVEDLRHTADGRRDARQTGRHRLQQRVGVRFAAAGQHEEVQLGQEIVHVVHSSGELAPAGDAQPPRRRLQFRPQRPVAGQAELRVPRRDSLAKRRKGPQQQFVVFDRREAADRADDERPAPAGPGGSRREADAVGNHADPSRRQAEFVGQSVTRRRRHREQPGRSRRQQPTHPPPPPSPPPRQARQFAPSVKTVHQRRRPTRQPARQNGDVPPAEIPPNPLHRPPHQPARHDVADKCQLAQQGPTSKFRIFLLMPPPPSASPPETPRD